MKEDTYVSGLKAIGFIGAGKVGFSMGKYLSDHGEHLTGYYSKTAESAKEAARYTGSAAFANVTELIDNSDTLFITVPDKEISGVWNCMKKAAVLKGKTVIHMSGATDTALFTGIIESGAYGFSLHPLCAVSDRYRSHETLSKALFTIEINDSLNEDYILKANAIKAAMNHAGNEVVAIRSEDKTLYHAAAVVASNMSVGLVFMAEQMLKRAGFSDEEASKALMPLVIGTTENIIRQGAVGALTGPVERNDVMTVKKHLSKLTEQEASVYKALTKTLIDIGKIRNNNADYSGMEELL